MVFSSVTFLFLYLPLVFAVYFLSRRRFKNSVILMFSLLFYFWGENYLLLIVLTSTMIDFLCGLLISDGFSREKINKLDPDGPRSARQKFGLVLSIVTNLSILGFFKYFNFGVDNFNEIMSSIGLDGLVMHDAMVIALPLGISFYTFQSMSYTIDVYRGQTTATRNLLDFACYVTMFPQLVAGPIVRYRSVEKQLTNREVTVGGFARGIERFIIGLGKKVIIANTVATAADAVFALPAAELSFSLAWIGVVAYTLQIYFDFSGYSDMAIGLGMMFGFRFPETLNYPYISRSIQEFWRRWHISLSSWFRDYLYIPLGGSQRSVGRTYLNLVTVFFLCGLWHGASWSFVVWGFYHGAFLVIERLGLTRLLDRFPAVLRHVYVMLVVMVGWVLFRAETLPQAFSVLRAMFGLQEGTEWSLTTAQVGQVDLIIVAVLGVIGSAPVLPALGRGLARLQSESRFQWLLQPSLRFVQFCCLAAIMLVITASLAADAYNPFIYFRF